MQFEFQYFQENKKNSNLEQMMEEVDKNSVDWDNFRSREKMSQGFNSQKPEKKNQPLKQTSYPQVGNANSSFDFQNSRSLSQISYKGGQTNSGFKFDQKPLNEQVEYNERYNRIEELLKKAKNNSLDAFYRNIEQSKVPQTNKFKDVNQFREYRMELKERKKQSEQQYNKIANPFNNMPQPQAKNNFKKKSFNEQVPQSFKNKQRTENKQNQDNKKQRLQINFLPQEFKLDNQYNDHQWNQDEVQIKLKQYQNDQFFKQGEQFFGQKQKSNKQYNMFDKGFFSSVQSLNNSKKDDFKQIKNSKLQPIREQKVELSSTIKDSDKMIKLLENYKQIKQNFNVLIKEVKQASSNKEHLAEQLKKLKEQFKQKQDDIQCSLEQEKNKKKERSEKLKQLKSEVEDMKEKGKDELFIKLDDKINSLQRLVRQAMQQVIEEKKQKLQPKIIQYSDEARDNFDVQLSLTLQHPENEMKWTPVQSQWPIGRKTDYLIEREEKHLQRSRETVISNIDNHRRRNLDLTSPLHLDLSRQIQEQQQKPPASIFQTEQFAKEYEAAVLQSHNRNLRKCLTQKSSVIYQSFQFHVTAKFSLNQEAERPVCCEVKVGNKCKLWLGDVFVVVYGPNACDLIMKPAKVLLDRLQPLNSFVFQVGINRQCVEDGGFSVQISYRGEVNSKKKEKVNFKVILPVTQLIQSLPVYEEQFIQAWSSLQNELYIRPKRLNFNHIRTHSDLKLLLPLTNSNVSCFSYALLFKYPLSEATFFLKIICYIEGKASLHLRSTSTQFADRKLKEDLLDVLHYLCFV